MRPALIPCPTSHAKAVVRLDSIVTKQRFIKGRLSRVVKELVTIGWFCWVVDGGTAEVTKHAGGVLATS